MPGVVSIGAAYRLVQRELVILRNAHGFAGEADDQGEALLHVIGATQSVRPRCAEGSMADRSWPASAAEHQPMDNGVHSLPE